MSYSIFKKKPTAKKLYIDGLNCLIDGKAEEALSLFTRSVNEDSENIEAYYHIGNICRDKDNLVKAEKIHSDLLNRPDLPVGFEKKVKLSLICDYLAMKDYTKAENMIVKAIKKNKELWLKEELLKIYEISGKWSEAIELKEEIDKINGISDPEKTALYFLESGLSVIKTNGKDARIRFKEAIKKNPLLPWPYILIADTYFNEERGDDAFEFWTKLFDSVPTKAYLIFDKIEKLYYESGAYGEVGRIYSNLVEREPNNIDALLALSHYLFKKSDKDEALSYCKKALEIEPNSRAAYSEFLHQKLIGANLEGEIRDIIEGMLKMYPAKKRYICKACQTRTEKAHWRCNSCGEWNPYTV